jgi:hypothetical protein
MPNDPRVKFKKKMYDTSHNIIGFAGSGGGRGSRSIFEEGGIIRPPPPDPGGGTGGGGGGVTPRDIPIIPQPLKPSLNPGEITGITIGSVAAAAALTEAARRTLEEQRRRRGMQPVSQSEQLRSRQSGVGGGRQRSRIGISRGIATTIDRTLQSFEMTPTRPFAPVSGTSTPDSFQSALSGTSTPESGELTSFRPSSSGFRQQPSALAPAPAPAPIQANRKPNRPLNLIQEIEMRQIEIRNPNISEARMKTLQSEITVLENQIRASGAPYTSLEERIALAINTPITLKRDAEQSASRIINSALEERAAIEIAGGVGIGSGRTSQSQPTREEMADILAGIEAEQMRPAQEYFEQQRRLDQRQAERDRLYSESLIELTPEERTRLDRTALFDLTDPNQVSTMTDAQFREFIKREKINVGGPTSGTGTPEMTKIDFLEGAIENIDLKLMDRQMPIARRQELIAQQTELRTTLANEQKIATDVNIKRAMENINIAMETRISSSRIPKTQTLETPTANNPVNDRITAVQPTREVEMQSLRGQTAIESAASTTVEVKTQGRSTLEKFRTEMQKAVTRNAIQQKPPPVPSNKAALERARAASARTSELEMRPLTERPIAPIERPVAPIERPLAVEIPKIPPPPPAPEPTRQPRPVEEMGEEIGGLRTQNAIAELNDIHDFMMESAKQEGFVVPEAPESIKAQGELEVKRYQYEQALEFAEREGLSISDVVIERGQRKLTGKALSKKKQLQQFQEVYERARIQEGGRPSARAVAAPAEARTAAPVERTTAPEARVATTEARVAAPEAMSARRSLSALPEPTATPTLTAPEPTGPRVRAQVQAIETTKKPLAPTETPGPSPPPSAPASETATPREGMITERTPVERAAFAEEVSLGLKGKKVPGRQKVKINSGVTNKGTVNPLEKFVGPQFRNTPNTEIHPSAKNLRGALAELGSRVPKLVPSKQVLISAGANLAAEGGGMVGGFFAGSEAGKAMTNYFKTHPPTNRTDEYGQALATSMVALGVGNIVSKAVTYAIRQGARIAMGAEITGSISGAGAAGLSALAEAALFATVATTTQFYVTKTLEDEGHSHAFSRTLGSIAATEALVYTEIGMWLAKGGPWNPAGDVAFIASELFIIGFGIWSAFEEFAEGTKQDQEEEAFQAEQRAERARAEQERRDTIASINRTNDARASFIYRLPTWNYDFDELYSKLTDKEKTDLGITTPETKLAFQRDIDRTFDPLGSFSESNGDGGLQPDPPILSQVEKDRREVINSYVNWYIDDLRHVKHEPFNFNDPKVVELNEYSGGTWQSAARVTAQQNHIQAERVHPLIEKAQNEIIDAFHNERKPIEQMDELTIRYATLDPTFRENYEKYIITDAAAQILIEFNNTQSTYNQVDPALLAIADRDPTFRAAADAYYQVLANQAREYQMSISDIAHLNSLMETDQAIEIGKLNDARNKIIEKNQAENQAIVDAYNANILREINIYGDNFDAIIRNINEQSLLSGHTFLYASNRADLYRQLHLEVPAIEFVDPVDEVDDTGKPIDATWHQGKGRKAGDIAVYNYRYNLTDEQNQEIEDMIAANQISRFDAEKQGLIIYNRDRAKFMLTDEEKAADLGLSLDAYYKKFGIVDPTVISTEPSYSDLQKLYPAQYRDLRQKYANDPDADKKIEDTLARAHKQRMEASGGIYTPLEQAPDLPVETLQQMYPDYYERSAKSLRKRDGTLSPESLKFIEIDLRMHHDQQVAAGTAPPVPAETREPTYEELQLMYPDQFDIYNDANITIGQEDKTEAMLRRLHARRTEAGTAPPLPVPDMPAIDPTLKNGIVNMPDGSTRTYRNGLVVNVMYGEGVEKMKLTDIKNAQEINAAEGVQNAGYAPTKTEPTTTLRQGALTMPDGSKRFYVDGKVVSVDYPPGVNGPTINEINNAEGVNSVPIANQAVDPGGLPTQIETPTPAREPTYEELQVMYPDRFQQYNRSYANAGNYNIATPSPEEQATAIEGLLRAEHANRTEAGTAPPLPAQTTPTPTTNQPLPFVPGARSFEYADSGTQPTQATKPTQRPGLDVVPEFVPGARSHEYMPSIVEPQNNAPTTTTNA